MKRQDFIEKILDIINESVEADYVYGGEDSDEVMVESFNTEYCCSKIVLLAEEAGIKFDN